MTSLTYRDTGYLTNESSPSNDTEIGRSKSSVFREGDYNLISLDPQDQFTSTHKKAFPEPFSAGMSMQKSYFHILPRYIITAIAIYYHVHA